MTTERERFEEWLAQFRELAPLHGPVLWEAWQAALSAPPDTESRRAQPAAPSDEVAAVLRYCRAVQQEGTVNERVVAQTVARMLAKPPDAAPSVAMNDRGKASDAPLDDAMKCALMKSVKFIDAAPSVAPEPVAWTTLIEIDWVKRNAGRAGSFYAVKAGPNDIPLFAHPPREASVAPEPVAWEGGEGWESLAWELCADENGEDACNELIWEGGPIPEPWGDRWMKYEGEAKRLIALVHKHAAHPPRAPLTPLTVPMPPQNKCCRDEAVWQDGWVAGWEAAHGSGGK